MTAHRMWGGRFTEPPDPRILEFTASFATDKRLLEWDLIGSIAHAMMLGETGIIPADDAQRIIGGLRSIATEARAGRLALTGDFEDVHSFIEAALYERIGAAAGRLHTARSRNDQVLTAFRLYVKEAVVILGGHLLPLIRLIRGRAAESIDIILPGFTHLQHAQPVRLVHHLLSYFWALVRDGDRLRDCYRRTDVLPLGSGAIAGVPYAVNRARVAALLGFGQITENSIDAVGDRDFAVDLVNAIALLEVHLSRWSGETVLWATDEFGFVELSDRVATGSSIMPQKKNPDAAELIRGRAGRAIGAATALLSVLKGLPSGYNSDLQEDKEITFGAVDSAVSSLRAMTALLQGTRFVPDRMRAAAGRGLLTATEVADYLTRKGIPFRDAHRLAGEVVQAAIERNCQIYELPLESFRRISTMFEPDVLDAVTLEASVDAREAPGGTGRSAIQEQLKHADVRDAEFGKWLEDAHGPLARARVLLEI